ncbi:MAG: PAS-domain containing protein [Alphaproteobacteria bacterium]|nr:PAS-domain containing protein [Alphaproteobacteria bacterium]
MNPRTRVFGALAIIGIIGAAAGIILHLHAIAIDHGTREMHNLSAVLAEQTARTLQGVELVLGSIDGELKRHPVSDRSGKEARAVHEMLHDKTADVPQIKRASVVGADGAMLASSWLYPSRGLSVADRGYFKAARDARGSELIIDTMVLSRVGDEPLIMVARRLSTADGTFTGVLTVGLDPSYFESVYKSAAELEGTAIALFRDDGSRLARYPHAERELGGRLQSPEFARYPKTGVYTKVSVFDGQSRLYTSERVRGYPLVITASIAEHDLLAGWRQEALFIGLIAAAAIAAVIALLVSLRRHAARARGHAMVLQDAVDALADGFVLYDRDDRMVMTNRKYRALHARNAAASRPGTRFEDVFRSGIARGELRLAPDEIDAVVRERVARHLNPSAPFEQRSGDRWLRISEHKTSDGGIVGIHADITELKQAQADAEAAEARMAQWAEAANDWFWEADEEGRMTYLSDGFGKTMGIAPAARLGQRRYSLAADFDVNDPKWQDHLKTLLAERPFRDFVYAATVPTGRRYISASGAPVFHADGRFCGYRGTSTDVTERIEAEQALARQADQLKTLVAKLDTARVEADAARARMADFAEASNDWLWEADAEGRLTYVSDAFEKTMGIPVARRIGAPRLDLTQSVDPGNPKWTEHLDDVANRRPFRDFVLAVPTDRGTTRHLSASGKPIYDGQGNFLGYRGTTRDVTAQMEVERAFARHSEMLASLIANLPIGVSLIGPDQRYRALNRPYLLRFGVPVDFVKPGDHIEKLVRFMAERGDYGPGDPETVVRQHLDWLWNGEPQQFERTQRDGRTIEVRRVPLPDGGYITTHVDVTEARQRERDLEEAHARLQRQTEIFSTLIEHLPVGVNLVDRDQRFMAFNRLFVDFFDMPADMLKVGDTFERFIRYNAERGEYGPGDVDTVVRKRIEMALDPRPANFERRRPNGRVIENRRVVLPGGGFVTTYIDVTDARRRESDLEDARARLERQTIELAATAEKLNAANSAKSLFLANMSHELRTPLNAILGFSEIMREALVGPLPTRYQNYARDIHASGTYLLRLINDVLDTSKIEVGQLRLQEEAIDLADLLNECERLVADKAAEAGIRLSRALPPDLPALLADRLRIKQIVLNLLSNAIKFTPPAGEVSVTVVRPADGGLGLCVSDTGIGMRPEDIPLALEPFRQLDNSFTRRYEGTGLGLPLAKALVGLHGGRLMLESTPQKGTRVTAWLPPHRIVEQAGGAVASGAIS